MRAVVVRISVFLLVLPYFLISHQLFSSTKIRTARTGKPNPLGHKFSDKEEEFLKTIFWENKDEFFGKIFSEGYRPKKLLGIKNIALICFMISAVHLIMDSLEFRRLKPFFEFMNIVTGLILGEIDPSGLDPHVLKAAKTVVDYLPNEFFVSKEGVKQLKPHEYALMRTITSYLFIAYWVYLFWLYGDKKKNSEYVDPGKYNYLEGGFLRKGKSGAKLFWSPIFDKQEYGDVGVTYEIVGKVYWIDDIFGDTIARLLFCLVYGGPIRAKNPGDKEFTGMQLAYPFYSCEDFGPVLGAVAASLFSALIKGEKEHPHLMGLAVDDTFEVMSEEELQNVLRNFLIKHYDSKLRIIVADTSMPFAKKSFMTRKIKTDIIPRLKRGELVSFDTNI